MIILPDPLEAAFEWQVPSMFDANADDWKVHLNREGYVVIKDLLLENVYA